MIEPSPLDRALQRGAGLLLALLLHAVVGAMLLMGPLLSQGQPTQRLAEDLFGMWACGLPLVQALYLGPVCVALFQVRPALAEGVLYGALLTLLLPAALFLLLMLAAW
jgi:hypothetical protein